MAESVSRRECVQTGLRVYQCACVWVQTTHRGNSLCVSSPSPAPASLLPQILCLSCLENSFFSLCLSLLPEAFLGEATRNSRLPCLVMGCSHQNDLLIGLAVCICLCRHQTERFLRAGLCLPHQTEVPNLENCLSHQARIFPKMEPNSVSQTELNRPH